MKIVIIGSNFAGIEVALKLKKQVKDLELTVIDKKTGTQFYPSMYELVTGKKNIEDLEISLEELYTKKGIKFLNEEVTQIIPDKKQVQTTKTTVDYDILVNAIGSVANYNNIPGALEFAMPFKNIEDTISIKDALEKITLAGDKRFDIVVAGSGLTGIELVFEIHEYLNNTKKNASLSIIEYCNDICPWTNIETRDFMKKLMKKENITVKTNFEITEVKKNSLISKNGETLNFDMLIWCAGLKVHTVNEKSGLEFDHNGLKVDDYFRSAKYPDIFVCGDAASKKTESGFVVPKSAHFAMVSSKLVSTNIIKTINKKPLKKFDPGPHTPILIDVGDYGAVMMYKKYFFKRPGKIYHFVKDIIETYWVKTRRRA